MKVSEYVVRCLEGMTNTIFMLSGGGIMHLVDSVGRSKKLQAVCTHHEQAASIAAEGYARITNKPGVVLVTTGPGGTNALTGVAGCWLDSIPQLVISGQVKTDNITPRKGGVPITRAIGFQELNVIDMARPITKYAVTIEDPKDIRYELEKAVYIATVGRPGPVWVEIPLDIQAMHIEPKKLPHFIPPKTSDFTVLHIPVELIISLLKKAKRPLLLVGNGIRLAGAEKELWRFLHKTGINTVTTMFTCDDLVTYQYPYYLGAQGMPGNETANWAIDNCDLLLVIGDRLQLTQTSYDYHMFAAEAFKIMVDIDNAELHKKTLQIDLPVRADAKDFLEALYRSDITIHRWDLSVKSIDLDQYDSKKNYVNPYKVVDTINRTNNRYDIATADGMASLIPHQALRVKRGTRFITNAGLGHMGSGLPLAIGACFANGKKSVLCMEGDGSLMLNIQELQTILYHKLPIKLFIYNNNGYFSIRHTHRNYFKRVFASDATSGLSLPNFEKLSDAWGFEYVKIRNNSELPHIKRVINHKGPIVCELMIDPDQSMLPKWTAGQFRGKKQP